MIVEYMQLILIPSHTAMVVSEEISFNCEILECIVAFVTPLANQSCTAAARQSNSHAQISNSQNSHRKDGTG